MKSPFFRLVRFKTSDGTTHYGEAGSEWKEDLTGKDVEIYEGDPFGNDLRLSGKRAVIAEVSGGHLSND